MGSSYLDKTIGVPCVSPKCRSLTQVTFRVFKSTEHLTCWCGAVIDIAGARRALAESVSRYAADKEAEGSVRRTRRHERKRRKAK